MALIAEWRERRHDRPRRHGQTSSGWSTFVDANGETLVQIDTYGSDDRAIPGKTSQSIQLDRVSAKRLIEILRSAFPGI